jgi:hypothetical protein
MTCHEFWDGMPELERDPVRLEHERQCASCAALLADQRALAAGLRRLARESRCQEPPVAIEAKLLEAFRQQTTARPGLWTRPWATAWRVWAPATAAAIALAVYLVGGYQPGVKRTGDLTTASVRSESANNDLVALDSEFIAAPYASGAVPAEDTDWVRLEVPGSALIALGLPVAVDAGSGRVQAEIALSANGVVEGVRLLQ